MSNSDGAFGMSRKTARREVSRTYVLVVLTLVSTFAYLDRYVMAAMAEPIKRDLGLSDTQLGLLTGLAFAMFYATFGIPIARLADRGDRVRIISGCITLWSAFTAACGLANSFLMLLLPRMGVGVGEAGSIAPGHSLLSDYYEGKDRTFAIGIFQIGSAAGIILGFMLGGFLASRIGWRSTLFVIGVPGLVVGILARLTLRDPRPTGVQIESSGREGSAIATIEALVRRQGYFPLLLAICLGLFSVSAYGQWLPTLFVRSHHLSIAQAGAFVGGALGLGSFIGTLGGALIPPRMVDRHPRWEALWPALAFGGMTPVFIAACWVPNVAAAVVLLFIAATGVYAGIPPAFSSIQTIARPTERAVAVAVIGFCSALFGQGGGPSFAGVVSDYLQPTAGLESLRYALSISGVFLLPCAYLFYRVSVQFLSAEGRVRLVPASDSKLSA